MRTVLLTIQPGKAYIAPKRGATLLQPPQFEHRVIGNAVSRLIVSVVVPSSNKVICLSVPSVSLLFKTNYVQVAGAGSSYCIKEKIVGGHAVRESWP